MGGLFAGVFGVYCATLCPGVYPGTSAVATGQVLGLLPGLPVSHPLWLAVSRIVAAIPVLEAPLRLNGVTALFGSLSVAWVFRLSRRVMLEMIRPASELMIVPVDDEDEEPQAAVAERPLADGGATAESDTQERLAATVGGLICALTFAFCAPHWAASVALHAQPLDLFVFLLAADLFSVYYFTGRLGFCVASVFLCGVLAVEGPSYALLSLGVLFLLVLACRRYDHAVETFFLLLLLSVAFGVAANLGLGWLQWGRAGAAEPASLVQAAGAFAQSYRAHLPGRASLDHNFFVWALPLLGLLLTAISLRESVGFRDEVGRWKWRMLNVLCTVFAVTQLVNAPKSIWALAREGSALPVLPALAVCCMTGMLFIYWYRMATVVAFSDDDEAESYPFWKRFIGLSADALLLSVALWAIGLNLPEADGKKAQFADAIAQETLNQAADAQCLLIDGALDLNVLIRAHVTGRKLAVVPASAESGGAEGRSLKGDRLPRLVIVRKPGCSESSPEEAVAQWLLEHPGQQRQVAVVGTPTVWLRTGTVVLPCGLIYSGALANERPDLSALLAKNQEVWRRIAPLLQDDAGLLPKLRQTRAAVRMYASRLANDFGVLLEQGSRSEEAAEAYAAALELDGKNLCAALNHFSLCLRCDSQPAQSAREFAGRPLLQAEVASDSEAFDELRDRYGTLLCQPADSFLPRLFARNPPDLPGRPEEVRLINHWLSPSLGTAAPSRVDPENEQSLAAVLRSHMEDGQRSPDLIAAVREHVEGRNRKAETLVRRHVANHPNNLAALSLLAELLIRREASQEVSGSVLPAMRATAGGIDNALVLMVQGGVCMNMATACLQEARACLLRALALNPHLEAAHDWLLEVDAKLGNDATSEADALLVIKNAPAHPFANALLGHLRAALNRSGEAEAFFRKSLSFAPSADVHAELAELLRRQGRLEEAEQQARLSIRMAPCSGSAWCVLSRVLADAGRRAEASDAQRCASTFASLDGVGNQLSSALHRPQDADTYMRIGTAAR